MVERLSRKQFLVIAGLTGAAGLAAAQFGPDAVSRALGLGRIGEPFPELREPNSIVFGMAPDKNNLGELKPSCSSIVNIFDDGLAANWGLGIAAQVLAQKKLPMLSITPQGFDGEFSLGNVVNYKQDLVEKAKAIGQLNGPILLRPFYEMNGNWFAHGTRVNSAADFVQAWRYFVGIFRQHAPNVKFVFAPNVTVGAEAIAPYYPGDEWVDIVGLDGYNKHRANLFDQEHFLEPRHFNPNFSFKQLFGPDFKELQRLTKGKKPMIITEVSTALEDPYSWLRNGLESLKTWSVNAVVLFNWRKDEPLTKNEANWDDPAIFRAMGDFKDKTNLVASPSSTEEILRTACPPLAESLKKVITPTNFKLSFFA